MLRLIRNRETLLAVNESRVSKGESILDTKSRNKARQVDIRNVCDQPRDAIRLRDGEWLPEWDGHGFNVTSDKGQDIGLRGVLLSDPGYGYLCHLFVDHGGGFNAEPGQIVVHDPDACEAIRGWCLDD